MPKKNASGYVTKSDDDRSRSENTGRKTFDPPVAPKGFTTWLHAQSNILHVSGFTPNVFERGEGLGRFHTCGNWHRK